MLSSPLPFYRKTHFRTGPKLGEGQSTTTMSRAQRLSASQSIPPRSPSRRFLRGIVLNAFRHHSLFHALGNQFRGGERECSTPFGITVYSTRVSHGLEEILFVLNAFRHHSLFHPEGSVGGVPDFLCAQRLSASQSIPPSTPYHPRTWNRVLNAFRHHSLFHRFRGTLHLQGEWCSTPFGITVYSTPDAVRRSGRVVVLNAFRHHSLFHVHR